jgi:hypothetical protein
MATDVRSAHALPSRITRAPITRRVAAFVDTHPVWVIFLFALAIRVIVSIGIATLHPNNIAPDGIQYSGLASAQATGHTAGWSAYDHWLYERVGSLVVPLTGLYELFGTHQLVGQLYVALFGAGVAAITTRLAMEVFATRWALVVGLIVALLPSQIVWSSLILKDATVWIALSGLALTVAVAGRSRGPRLLALGIVAAALLIFLGYLRLQTLEVAAWALMLAALVGPRRQRLPRIGGALALGILIPWLVFGMGPAGITFVRSSEAPSSIRAGNAVGAKSAIAPGPAPTTAPSPAASAAAGSTDESEVSADVNHLPRGLVAMIAEPFPWQAGGSVYVNLARVQDLVWYPLLLLALLGLLTLRPRHLRVMAFPLLAGGAILILYALTEGNVGTAFRHRGEFEWVIAFLAAFGLIQLATWRSRRRGASSPQAARPAV